MAGSTQHVVQRPGGPSALVAVPTSHSVHVFHQVGSIAGTMSDDFPVMMDGTATLVLGRLTTPGSTTTEVTAYLNAVSIGVFTIPAGEHVGLVALSSAVSFTDQDYFNVQVTSVGLSSAGLWVGVYV